MGCSFSNWTGPIVTLNFFCFKNDVRETDCLAPTETENCPTFDRNELDIEYILQHDQNFESIPAAFKMTNVLTRRTQDQAQLIKSAIKDSLVFSSIYDDEIELIISLMGTQEVKAGQHVIREGETSTKYFIISQGKFTIFKGGDEIITLTRGESFSELALTSSKNRIATVRAETDGCLYTLEKETYLYILATSHAKRRIIVTETLSKVPSLSKVSKDDLHSLIDHISILRFMKGDTILRKDQDDGDILYIIHEGCIQVTDLDFFPDHERDVYSVFGEKDLISGELRKSNIIALTNCVIFAIHRQIILHKLNKKIVNNWNIKQHLSNLEFLKCYNDNIISELLKGLHINTYHHGDVICEQNEEGEDMFMIRDGVARVYVDGDLLGTLHSGQYFGESALMDDEIRPATVIAHTHCTIFILDRDTFTSTVGRLSRRAMSISSRNWLDRVYPVRTTDKSTDFESLDVEKEKKNDDSLENGRRARAVRRNGIVYSHSTLV